jgi:hypothetical protein
LLLSFTNSMDCTNREEISRFVISCITHQQGFRKLTAGLFFPGGSEYWGAALAAAFGHAAHIAPPARTSGVRAATLQ